MAPSAVSAHALPVASVPAPGAVLQEPPTSVVIWFNEAPDPALSSIQILDINGGHHEVGHAVSSSGAPRVLSVKVRDMSKGTYTVAWLTVSASDGHRVSGSFEFGVQVVPPTALAAEPGAATSALSVIAVGARAVFYVSIVLLLGGIGVGFLVGVEHAGRLRAPLIAANLLAVVGVAGITEGQLSAAGSSWSQLVGTSLTGAFVTRLVPVLVGAVALLAAPRLSQRMQRPMMAIAWTGAALSSLADAAANHASTEAIPILSVLLQWVHILAGGLWVGGLAALILVISATPSEGRRRLLERFAAISIACLIVIAVTGVLRSVAAIGSWQGLVTTGYGALVLAKVGLILVLAILGAANRLNSVRSSAPVQGFRRIASAQVVAGAAALVLSATLVNVAPPSATALAFSGPTPLVATGSDGTALRVRLEVSPGTAGYNNFTVVLTDYSTGVPINDATVTLGFLYGAGTIGGSALELTPAGQGTYSAFGANLSLKGAWSMTAQVQTPKWIYDVYLQLTTRRSASTSSP
ncbi:MAG: copper resistance protein CopC [Candidatus Dormibacteria bacterium]